MDQTPRRRITVVLAGMLIASATLVMPPRRSNSTPAFRAPGRYEAVFFPTVATTYSFRLHGTINAVPVDLTFSCNPAGHVAAAEDRSVVKVSATVTRKGLVGSYGCPEPRTEAEFPPLRR